MRIINRGVDDWVSDRKRTLYKDYNQDVFVQTVIAQYDDEMPKINTIEIETINRCNNDCSFCPVAKGHDIRQFQRMSEELFHRIIDELSEMDYSGYISLFANNEPLMDARIFDFMEYAREKLPNAMHALYTNGILLDREKYIRMIKTLDYLVIDNYNDEMKLNDNIAELVDVEIPEEIKCQVVVYVRKKNQILYNRGGIAPNKLLEGVFTSGCTMPFMQMVIRPDGKVSRCAQDAYGFTTLADVTKQGIQAAWKSREYCQMRKLMREKGRLAVEGCQNCDMFGLHNYFPLHWIYYYNCAFLKILCKQKKDGKKLIFCGFPKAAEETMALLELNGLYPDEFKVDIGQVREDEFYIFSSYDWEKLEKFLPEDAGRRFIIFIMKKGVQLHKSTNDMENRSEKQIFMEVAKAQRDNRLVIFGAGRNAVRLEELYNFKVAYYVDNNSIRIGESFLNSIICEVEKVLADQSYILISANDYSKIKKQLLRLGVPAERIGDGNRLL